MSIDRNRVVEIKAGREGSGYLIGPHLVLTARHNIRPHSDLKIKIKIRILGDFLKSAASARPPDPNDLLYDAQVIFPDSLWDDANIPDADDFALLYTETPTSSSVDLADWINVPDTGQLEFAAIGFPGSALFDFAWGRERDVADISGSVWVNEKVKQRERDGGGLVLHVSDDLRPRGAQDWAGFSGAAVFANGHLFGLATRAVDEKKLHCIPASQIFNKPGVAKAVQGAGLQLPQDADLSLSPEVIHKIRSLQTSVSLRVLVASSSPTQSGNVNTEVASIKRTVAQLVDPQFQHNISVSLFECLSESQLQEILPAYPDDRGGIVDLDSIDEFHIVIFVVWENLGEEAPYLSSLRSKLIPRDAPGPVPDGEAQDKKPIKIRFLRIYRRIDDPVVSLTDTTHIQQDRYEHTKTFFSGLDEDGIRYDKYKVADFTSMFQSQFWHMIEDLTLPGGTHAPGWRRNAKAEKLGEPSQADNTVSRGFKNPYKGLSPYRLEDGSRFFGRLREIEHLTRLVSDKKRGLIPLLGASGSGKSSLVRAGLLPLLKFNVIPDSMWWEIIDFSIAEYQPALLNGIAHKFMEKLPNKSERRRIKELEDSLVDPTDFRALVEEIFCKRPKTSNPRVFMLIDQFEELFTYNINSDEQHNFLLFLMTAIQSELASVLICCRSDFYHQILEMQGLAEALKDAAVYSPPRPSAKSLLSIIRWPALLQGLVFEDENLPMDILAAVGADASTLPILSYALEWLATNAHEMSNNVITRALLPKINEGIRGMIETNAEKAIRKAAKAIDKAAKAQPAGDERDGAIELAESIAVVFRHLVSISENKKPARQVSSYRNDDASWTDSARYIADELVEERLLVTDRAGEIPVIQIAHESVIENWKRLREWTEQNQTALLAHRRVQEAAEVWKKTRDSVDGEMEKLKVDYTYLWTGARLGEAEDSLRRLGIERINLPQPERDFLRPEHERLCAELYLPIDHARRAFIGNRLSEIGDGDRRPGVGVTSGLPDIMWCPKIPAGVVQMQIDHDQFAFDVKAFYIAKYVITLAQFNMFTDSSAYRNDEWWIGLETEKSQCAPIQQSPAIKNHPAQWISWYQAVAYCRWLSHALDYTVRLPTEWEWQRAAIGDHTDFLYPWGSEWNSAYANTREGGVGQVVSVGLYPKGASPFGAMDMSGNMVEWCQNQYDNPFSCEYSGRAARTTRGGSWFGFGNEPREAVKVTARLKDNPDGYNERGDRIRASIRLASDEPNSEALAGSALERR